MHTMSWTARLEWTVITNALKSRVISSIIPVCGFATVLNND